MAALSGWVGLLPVGADCAAASGVAGAEGCAAVQAACSAGAEGVATVWGTGRSAVAAVATVRGAAVEQRAERRRGRAIMVGKEGESGGGTATCAVARPNLLQI